MRVQCKKCGHRFDIKENAVLAAAGQITAKRRAKAGGTMTSEQARQRSALGHAAKARKRAEAEQAEAEE